jgi:hypothetical protein
MHVCASTHPPTHTHTHTHTHVYMGMMIHYKKCTMEKFVRECLCKKDIVLTRRV